MQKQFVEVPLPMSCSLPHKLLLYLKGGLLSPIYLLSAYIVGGPGIGFHLRCVLTGIKLLITGRSSLKTCYKYLFFPLDSTRYFEFHEVWQCVKNLSCTRILDVSSPRFLPLFFLKATPEATAELINPDSSDLKETEKLAEALGVKSRCKFFNGTLDKRGFTAASFDLITCVSVLEHIPNDTSVLETMWSLLRPEGRLILTLPCMSQPLEQYINHNRYGVLSPGDDGYTFWQRYYDRQRIEDTIYRVTGKPSLITVYGEKQSGFFFRNTSMKRLLGALYPFWREPYMMATEYQVFESIEELPGEGVVVLEFVKPGEN